METFRIHFEKSLRNVLMDDQFWDITLNRMILKKRLDKSQINRLYVIKDIHREEIVDFIMSGEYEWGIPEKIEISKSGTNKKRVVYIYPIEDRYVLGVLYRALSEYHRDLINSRCFSYKTQTSTNDAIKYIKSIEGFNNKYGVKIDIHAYFNSVNREKVKDMVRLISGGEYGLKNTLDNLMLNDRVLYKGKELYEWKSLIPGCAMSSLFANLCLKECDDYFSARDVIYARYSDDIIILDDTQSKLREDIDIVKYYLRQYGLEINTDKYTWFRPNDDVEYLGLKLCGDGRIDISDHAKKKIKTQIHRWCRKGRVKIEVDRIPFDEVAKGIIKRLNFKNMFCIIDNESKFGWCHYAFRYINTIDSLKEIDFYTRDTLRAMKTGKHNKSNTKAIDDAEFKSLGWVSLVDMYNLYHYDFDYYMEVVELMKNSNQ